MIYLYSTNTDVIPILLSVTPTSQALYGSWSLKRHSLIRKHIALHQSIWFYWITMVHCSHGHIHTGRLDTTYIHHRTKSYSVVRQQYPVCLFGSLLFEYRYQVLTGYLVHKIHPIILCPYVLSSSVPGTWYHHR